MFFNSLSHSQKQTEGFQADLLRTEKQTAYYGKVVGLIYTAALGLVGRHIALSHNSAGKCLVLLRTFIEVIDIMYPAVLGLVRIEL